MKLALVDQTVCGSWYWLRLDLSEAGFLTVDGWWEELSRQGVPAEALPALVAQLRGCDQKGVALLGPDVGD